MRHRFFKCLLVSSIAMTHTIGYAGLPGLPDAQPAGSHPSSGRTNPIQDQDAPEQAQPQGGAPDGMIDVAHEEHAAPEDGASASADEGHGAQPPSTPSSTLPPPIDRATLELNARAKLAQSASGSPLLGATMEMGSQVLGSLATAAGTALSVAAAVLGSGSASPVPMDDSHAAALPAQPQAASSAAAAAATSSADDEDLNHLRAERLRAAEIMRLLNWNRQVYEDICREEYNRFIWQRKQ